MKTSIAVALATLGATAASAATTITYSFAGSLPAFTFEYESNGFITGNITVLPGQLKSGSSAITSVQFCPAGTACGVAHSIETFDAVYIRSSSSQPIPGAPAVAVGNEFDFGPKALTTVGRYTSKITGAGSMLTVNDGTLPAAVPEPATWAMMLAGFGGIGVALRRSRRAARPRAA